MEKLKRKGRAAVSLALAMSLALCGFSPNSEAAAADMVTITYDTGGATFTETVAAGEGVDLSRTAEKSGWVFAGWSTNASGKQALTEYSTMEDTTLYALFYKKVTVNFIQFTGTETRSGLLWGTEKDCSIESPNIAPTEGISDLLPDMDLSGWKPRGWVRRTNGADKEVTCVGGEAVNVTGDLTLYCSYEKEWSTKYVNDGDDVIKSYTQFLGYNKKVSTDALTATSSDVTGKDGWVLEGWSSGDGDVSITVSPGLALPSCQGEMFAVYSKEYSITFDCASSMSAKTFRCGETVEPARVILPSAEKRGYSLEGWTINGAVHGAGEEVILEKDVSAMAVWKKQEKYFIDFNGNGATGGLVSSAEVQYGEEYVLPENRYSRVHTVEYDTDGGYCPEKSVLIRGTFCGWSKDKDGTALMQPGEKIKFPPEEADLTLFASWSGCKVKLPTPTKSTYIFKGWTDGKAMYNGEITVASDMKLKAVWGGKEAKITVDTCDGTNVEKMGINAENHSVLPALPKIPEKVYTVILDYGSIKPAEVKIVRYVPLGIYSKKNGQGVMYYDRHFKPVRELSLENGNTIYVHWQPVAMKLPDMESEGYEVSGWSDGKTVYKGEYTPTKNTTLTLVRKAKKFKVSLDADGGVLQENVTSYIYGDEVWLPEPEKDGCVFTGWRTDDGTVMQKISKDMVGDIALTAGWKETADASFFGDTTLKKITVPDSMSEIAADMFNGCISLSDVAMPNTIVGIGAQAFYRCASLSAINLPDSVSDIGDRAFYGCSSLDGLNFGSALKTVGKSAFEGCSSLKRLIFSSQTKKIGDSAFKDCVSVEKVSLGKNLGSIGAGVFSGCTSLSEIQIPASVTEVGDGAFNGCNSLVKLSVLNPKCAIGEIGLEKPCVVCGFRGSTAEAYAEGHGLTFMPLNNAYILTVYADGGTAVSKRIEVYDTDGLPDVLALPKDAGNNKYRIFLGYESLKDGSVKVGTLIYDSNGYRTMDVKVKGDISLAPKWKIIERETPKVTSVSLGGIKYRKRGNAVEAVSGMDRKSLTVKGSVKIGGMKYPVVSIGAKAFSECKKLRSLTIGGNVQSIGIKAFYRCKNLGRVNIKARKVSSVAKDAFKGTKKKLKINVPKSCRKKYRKLFSGRGNKTVIVK